MKYKSIHSDTQKSLDNLAVFVHGFPPLVDKLLASLAMTGECLLRRGLADDPISPLNVTRCIDGVSHSTGLSDSL